MFRKLGFGKRGSKEMNLGLKAKFWICLVLAVVVTKAGLLSGFRLEEMQLVAFPLVVLAFVFIGSNSFRPPLVGLALVFVFWGLSGLRAQGYLPGFSEGVYLARLTDDVDGTKAELFRQRYRRAVRINGLPKINLLLKEINSSSQAKAWLENNSKGLVLLSGDSHWLNFSLPGDFSRFLSSLSLIHI